MALTWELLWPRLWPVVGLAGLFIAVALFDLLPMLPSWLHGLLLAGFAFAAAWFLWVGLRGTAWPDVQAARHRLERASGLSHRPLTGLEDRLASGGKDPAARALWDLHRQRLLAQMARLRVGLPRASLVRADPLALRTLVVLLLVVAVTAGGHNWQDRLLRALAPDVAAATRSASGLDVWITPPDYTGLPPLLLETEAGAETTVRVPSRSQVLAQVHGGRQTPVLTAGAERVDFEAIAEDTYKVGHELTAGEWLEIRQGGRALARWPLEIIPDQAPEVEFLSPPGGRERNALRVEYGASDDYGLVSIEAKIRRIGTAEVKEPLVLELPLPGTRLKAAESASYHDLTPHPWAGLAVEIQLIARDALGQEGRSDPVQTVLPERIFNHPVARALIELRKQLTVEPDKRFPVVRALGQLYERPEHFFHDLVVALALRSAERRLIYDKSPAVIPSVQQLLWDTALRIEDGELALAESDLRAIQEALQEALARGADQEEIQQLLDELEQALDRFISELTEQLMRDMEAGQEFSELGPNDQMLRSQDLQEIIDAARDQAQAGALDAARELLAQLQEMLENLRANPFAQGGQDQGRQATEMMREMERLMDRQQDLLDRSFERNQRGGEMNQERFSQENAGDAGSQDDLRRALGEMMRRLGDALGDIPQPLGRAEQAMRDAIDALKRDQPGDAVGPQGEALDRMQQGMQSMVETMMQQMGQGMGGRAGVYGWRPGTDQDPLGRNPPGQGQLDTYGVKIPDQMELRRARQILQELQRRAGQPTRPRLERDYIERLLKRFE